MWMGLTFFYRHMPEVIEKGYLYIAQPPLFKVTEGKKDIYIKNEEEFNKYLIQRAISKSEVIVKETNKKLTDKKLNLLLEKILLFNNLSQRIQKKGYPNYILRFLLKNGIQNQSPFLDKQNITKLQRLLGENGFETVEVYWDEENNLYGIEVRNTNGKEERTKIHWGLISSVEYQHLFQVYQEIQQLAPPPYVVFEDGNKVVIEEEEGLLQSLGQLGKEGLTIQRYKGLGEMNPEQLWETTMNPQTRTLLKVTIEDAIEADEIFSILMGDEVEQRRKFIEENALMVQRLDI